MEGYLSGFADAAPYFFLSYASCLPQEGYPSDLDIWVVNLVQDPCSHITQFTNLPLEVMPGFMDRKLRARGDWRSRLAEEFATFRVFVPLYSRRHFDSEHCGKEWFACSHRALDHSALAGFAEAIVPALWIPVAQVLLPETAKSIQFDHSRPGERYSTHGFYRIIKLSRYRSEYEEAVFELTRQMVEVAHSKHIGPEPPVRCASSRVRLGLHADLNLPKVARG